MRIGLIAILVALGAWWIYLHKRVSLKKYGGKYAVVTGCTSGVGLEALQQLSKEFKVIMIARNKERIAEVLKKNPTVLCFNFDFTEDLYTFAPRFDKFLEENKIDKQDISVCYSNHGHGEYKPFHETSYERKQKMMQVNIDAHVCISDYFMKIFMKRRENKLKSALIFTSSADSNIPMFQWQLYATAKSGLTALANALHAEYKFKGIDVLAVQPGAIQSHFFQHEYMTELTCLEKYIKYFALTPKAIVNQAFCRLGKVSVTNVGYFAKIFAILSCFGNSVNAFLWSFAPVMRQIFWVPVVKHFKLFQ